MSEVENIQFEIDSKIDYQAIVEGLLYVVGEEGLQVRQVASILELSESKVKEIFTSLIKKYNDSASGLEISDFAGCYKFLTKPLVFEYANRLFKQTKKNKLSQSALETLAIIAYKQPITRIEIEELRGVSCDMMLRKLQARNLISEAGRSEAVGRPILYEVTDEFMDLFSLYSLEELPEINFLDSIQQDLFD